MHIQHTRHQLPLDGVGLRGLDVDSVNSSSDYFTYLCIHASESMHHLNMHRIAMKFVPQLLTNDQKQQHVNMS
jgi:hypothetical protein